MNPDHLLAPQSRPGQHAGDTQGGHTAGQAGQARPARPQPLPPQAARGGLAGGGEASAPAPQTRGADCGGALHCPRLLCLLCVKVPVVVDEVTKWVSGVNRSTTCRDLIAALLQPHPAQQVSQHPPPITCLSAATDIDRSVTKRAIIRITHFL